MPQELRPEVIAIPYWNIFFIAEYKTRPNGFDLQLVLVSCPMGQVKKNVNVEAFGKHL
jgi:hypothetical protein